MQQQPQWQQPQQQQQPQYQQQPQQQQPQYQQQPQQHQPQYQQQQQQVYTGQPVKAAPPAPGDATQYGATPNNASQQPVQGVPLYDGFDNEATSGKFVVQGYKDIWAAAIFVLGILMTVVWGIYNFSNGLDSTDPDKDHHLHHTNGTKADDKSTPDDEQEPYIVQTLLLLVVISICASLCSLAAIMKWPRQAIIVANVVAGLLTIAAGFAAFAAGSVFMGVIFLLFGIFQLVWLYFARHRIPFAALLLNISCNLTKRYKAMVGTNVGMMALFTVFTVFFSAMSYPVSMRASHQKATGGDSALICLYLLIFFWASQVAINIGHVTSSGLVATWYFVGDGMMPPNPTLASFKRATTTSLGSICFGSLLVAILRLLRTIAQWNRNNDNNFVACIMECVLACLERLLEYFNVYAFVHVAIYGCGYIEAAKRTWEMCKQCLFAALFNDCLIGPTLSLTALGVSLLLGVITALLTSIVMGVLAFLICFCCHIMIFRSVESSVVTIFVCFAEAPTALAHSSPDLYAAINAANAGQNVV